MCNYSVCLLDFDFLSHTPRSTPTGTSFHTWVFHTSPSFILGEISEFPRNWVEIFNHASSSTCIVNGKVVMWFVEMCDVMRGETAGAKKEKGIEYKVYSQCPFVSN